MKKILIFFLTGLSLNSVTISVNLNQILKTCEKRDVKVLEKNGCYCLSNERTKHQKWLISDARLDRYMSDNLNVLQMLNDFCKDNDIFYTLNAGSLAGLYWCNGPIPWDDDIDIIMDVESYHFVKKYFWKTARRVKRLELNKRWIAPKQRFRARVKEHNGKKYDTLHVRGMLKIIPFNSVKRMRPGGVDIARCVRRRNQKFYDASASRSNPWKGCINPRLQQEDIIEVDFGGIKTMALKPEVGHEVLSKMYGNNWKIPCSFDLKSFYKANRGK